MAGAAFAVAAGIGIGAAGIATGELAGLAAMAVAVALPGDTGGAVVAAAFELAGATTKRIVGFRAAVFVRIVLRTAREGVGIVDADEVHTGFAGVGAIAVAQAAFVADPAGVFAGGVWAADLGGGIAIGVLADMRHTMPNRARSRTRRWGIAIAIDAALGRLAQIDTGIVVGAAIATSGVAGAAKIGAFTRTRAVIVCRTAEILTGGPTGADRGATAIDHAAFIGKETAFRSMCGVAYAVGGRETAGAVVGGAALLFRGAGALATGIVATGGIAGSTGSDILVVAAGRPHPWHALGQSRGAFAFLADRIPGLHAGAFGDRRGGRIPPRGFDAVVVPNDHGAGNSGGAEPK